MSDWKDDVIEQISIALYLLESGLETAERLSMIITDNAVEFTLKAYVETEQRGVGSGKLISKKDWEQKKSRFPELVDFVLNLENTTADKTKILEYHDLRNGLYHDRKTLSIKPKKILAYIEQCKIILYDFAKFSLSDAGWQGNVNDIKIQIERKTAKSKKPLIRYDCSSKLPKFNTAENLNDTDAVMIDIDCYTVTEGDAPTIQQLESILTMSRHPIDQATINKRISHLRGKKLMRKDVLKLDPDGYKNLQEKFFIDS